MKLTADTLNLISAVLWACFPLALIILVLVARRKRK